MSAERSSKPTICLVPGAYHTSVSFESLKNSLGALSHPSTAYTLPSIASSKPFSADAIADGVFIRSKLEDLIEAGKDVVLVAHSYGGIPGAAAASGLSKKKRQQQGKQGGVIGLVLISALLTKEGESCYQKMQGLDLSYTTYNENTGAVDLVPDEFVPIFFNDLSEPDAVSAAASTLRPQAMRIFVTESSRPAWAEPAFRGRCVYVRCKRDACIPTSLQDAMVKASGVEWTVEELDSGHCPFFSVPDSLAQTLVRYAKEFSKDC